MAKKGELVVLTPVFDYAPLEPAVAEKVKDAADRIRDRIKRTLEGVMEVGADLLAVKDSLDHGQFGAWLKAEFGWTIRTAQNFMSVAERFGPKNEIISHLDFQPTAAYLLAAPSVPDEARQTAIERAEGGEKITMKVAREIVAKTKKKRKKKVKTVPTEKLSGRLGKVLERYRERWDPKEISELSRQLREFADELDEAQKGGRKKSG